MIINEHYLTDVDDEDLDVDDEDNSNPSTNEKDVQAFIQLRQLNKQMKEENRRYKDYIDFLDERAKNLGLSGVDEFMEKLYDVTAILSRLIL